MKESQKSDVHMPFWLLHIPYYKLSMNAKVIYGRLERLRLDQWCKEKHEVSRSARQLASDIGVSFRTVERSLKELRDKKLIETYQIKTCGINHYRFYEHEWMNEKYTE